MEKYERAHLKYDVKIVIIYVYRCEHIRLTPDKLRVRQWIFGDSSELFSSI